MPKRARDALKASGVIRTALEWVGVDDALDDVVTDQPYLGFVLLGRVRNLLLVHAPLNQHPAADRTPKLERVDQVAGSDRLDVLAAFRAGALGVDGQPLMQAVLTVLGNHATDSVLAVAFHPNEGFQ